MKTSKVPIYLSLILATMSLTFCASNSFATSKVTPALPHHPFSSFGLDSQLFLYLDFRNSRGILNQTRTDVGTFSMESSLYDSKREGYDPKQDSLTVDNFKDGLMVFDERGFDGGIGFQPSWYFSSPTFPFLNALKFEVGLAPIRGQTIQVEQHTESLAAAKSLKKMIRIPATTTEFESWAIDDSVTLQTMGGIAFSIGFSQFPGSISAIWVAKGTWIQTIRKISPHEVYIKISKENLSSLTTEVSGTLISLSLSKFSGHDKSFAFKVNLDSEVGRKAYHEILSGNLADLQAFMHNNPNNGAVETIDFSESRYAGNSQRWFFGIPILLNASESNTEIFKQDSFFHFKNQEETKVQYGISLYQKDIKIFSESSTRRSIFWVANFEKEAIQRKTTEQGVIGEFNWSFESKRLDSYALKEVISEVIKKTGLYSQLKVNVPNVGNIGYTRLDLKLRIPPEGMQSLWESIARTSRKNFRKVAEEYFKTIYRVKRVEDRKECLPENPQICFAPEEDTLTWLAIDKMWREIHSVRHSLTSGELTKSESLALARFGNAMGTSVVTFQTALGMMGENVFLNYKIQGERLNHYEVDFHRKADSKFEAGESPNGSIWRQRRESPDFTLPRPGSTIAIPRNLPFPINQ